MHLGFKNDRREWRYGILMQGNSAVLDLLRLESNCRHHIHMLIKVMNKTAAQTLYPIYLNGSA